MENEQNIKNRAKTKDEINGFGGIGLLISVILICVGLENSPEYLTAAGIFGGTSVIAIAINNKTHTP
jgi:hypothetical protein